MPGYNLQTYKQTLLQRIEGRHGVGSSFQVPDSAIFQWLGEAYRIIQNETGLFVNQNLVVDFVAGQSVYVAPPEMVGNRVVSIYINDSSGAKIRTPLQQMTYEAFQLKYNTSDIDAGTPVDFALVPWRTADIGVSIAFGPAPNYSIANAVLFNYVSIANEALHRIYNQTTITATATVGNTFITLSDLVSGNIKARDEVGIVRTTQTDGQSIPDDVPRKWFTITEKDNTGAATILNLNSTYDEETNFAGAQFVTAQVAEIEQLFPQLIGWAPVNHMLHEFYLNKDAQLATYYKTLFDQAVQNISLNQADGIDNVSPAPQSYTPFARRGF